MAAPWLNPSKPSKGPCSSHTFLRNARLSSTPFSGNLEFRVVVGEIGWELFGAVAAGWATWLGFAGWLTYNLV